MLSTFSKKSRQDRQRQLIFGKIAVVSRQDRHPAVLPAELYSHYRVYRENTYSFIELSINYLKANQSTFESRSITIKRAEHFCENKFGSKLTGLAELLSTPEIKSELIRSLYLVELTLSLITNRL